MHKVIRIGTRDSQLAVWQALQVQQGLQQKGYPTELVKIKSEGDLDLQTPLYEMGVQGVFTRALDAALLGLRIDVAVHSMKDVPTIPAIGVVQAAVLERGSPRDLLVYNNSPAFLQDPQSHAVIATGSVRRKAQWLYRYPAHQITDLRGNVNTRLRKLEENAWDGAIFAAAGLERIGLRPLQAIELDWMLPAPAQGIIMVVCRETDSATREACAPLNHFPTAIAAKEERSFLRTLLGGCSTPISAYARIENENLVFEGNILSTDGKQKAEVKKEVALTAMGDPGREAAETLLAGAGRAILEQIRSSQNAGEKNQ